MAEAQPEWITHLEETKSRLFIFLDKLENRMQELTNEAVPALEGLKLDDEREFENMLNGVRGQLNSVSNKAKQTYDEKVEDLYQNFNAQINALHPYHNYLTNFRITCSDRLNQQFKNVYKTCINQLEATEYTDYEVLYQKILDEFETIKNTFKCHQCGSNIPLEKIYFIETYLTCPSCQTKNTFSPSTLAKNLEHIGRSLAEQRTEPLLAKYYDAQKYERNLYHQAHELKLQVFGIQNKSEKEQLQLQITNLENKRIEVEKSIPLLYQKYQRAMFDEWKILVPDLSEQTENFYQNLQKR